MLNTFSENLYDILNLKIDASDQQIKQSFRQLSLKFHPDKDKDPIIKDKYLKILEMWKIAKISATLYFVFCFFLFSTKFN